MSLTTGSVPPSGVNDLAGQSRYYLVVITSTRYGDVYAWLPDDIRLWVNSSWGPIVGNVDSALANYVGTIGGSKVLGYTPGATFFSKKLTAQEWRGVEPLTLQLPLHFFAVKNAATEVVEPIKRLIKMSLPKQIGDSSNANDLFNLAPPGPVPTLSLDFTAVNNALNQIPGVSNFNAGGGLLPNNVTLSGQYPSDIINVYIGNFLILKGVFIHQINNVEFKSKLSVDGLPMEGLCDVMFRTVFAPSSDDIDAYIGNNLDFSGEPTIGT
jgi:hypothetical protein